jgi:hypothetical protein
MEQEQTRLRRDGDANLIRQLEAAAALEIFFRQEHLDMTEELALIGGRKLAKESDIARQNGVPRGRNGLRAEPLSPTLFRKAEDHAGRLGRIALPITSSVAASLCEARERHSQLKPALPAGRRLQKSGYLIL